jgi:hypothetical protein
MSGSLLTAFVIGLLAVPEAYAQRGRGGHSGGRAPHVSAPHQAYIAPQMPRAAAPARANAARSQAMARNTQIRANNAGIHAYNARIHANNAQAPTNQGQVRANNAQALANGTPTTATRSSVLGSANPSTAGTINTTPTAASSISPNAYTYGSGAGARSYQAYGYGRGYHNRSYGSRYGYGRSQGSNRAIVSRLRSVHASLARIDHDYQGHRVRAMHAISMAIRQLAHQSTGYGNTGFSSGVNNRQAMGMQRGGLGAGAGGGRRGQPMTQAQSDNRMSQDLRALQGINMQLSNQGSYAMGHAQASGHVQRAMHELNTALSIR